MAPVTHIVLFRYRNDIPWTKMEEHFRDFQSLKQACLKGGEPYMQNMRMGKNKSWENYHRGMTHCIILEFASQEDLDYYLTKDKAHHDFSARAAEFVEDSTVVDFTDGELFANMKLEGKSQKVMSGSCHCGDIQWDVTLEEYRHVICHCRTCQLLGGGPYSCNAVLDKGALKIKQGKLSVYTYTGASGKPVLCYYCGICTSHVYHHQMTNPDKIIVRTLLLRGGNKMGLAGEIFAQDAVGWAGNLKAALAK